MNSLAKNIEYLLLSRNFVIVPSLGEFCTADTPAKWVDAEEMFLPPVRFIHFESSVQSDPEDHFVRHLAENYGCTIEAARKRCKKMVEQFHRTLISEGTVDFGSIGIFTLEDDAEITLAACECGVIAPNYYGLDTLHFAHIGDEERVSRPHKTIMEIIPEKIAPIQSQNNTTNQQATSNTNQNSMQDDDHYTIRLNKSVVNYAMAVAATIALFFIMRPTTISVDSSMVQQARPVMFLQPEMVKSDASILFDDEENNDILADDEVIEGALIDVTETASENKEVEASEVEAEMPEVKLEVPEVKKPEIKKPEVKPEIKPEVKPEVKPEPKPATSAFCIVLASGVSKVNAEAYAQKLVKEGIKASVLDGELRRVVIDGFATYEEAHRHMATLKAAGQCPDAWVLKK